MGSSLTHEGFSRFIRGLGMVFFVVCYYAFLAAVCGSLVLAISGQILELCECIYSYEYSLIAGLAVFGVLFIIFVWGDARTIRDELLGPPRFKSNGEKRGTYVVEEY